MGIVKTVASGGTFKQFALRLTTKDGALSSIFDLLIEAKKDFPKLGEQDVNVVLCKTNPPTFAIVFITSPHIPNPKSYESVYLGKNIEGYNNPDNLRPKY
jgi:hypothetical protein